jgi:hypothetical protein
MRPDALMVYDIPWPPPPLLLTSTSSSSGGGGGSEGLVMSPIHEGSVSYYPWGNSLSVNMMSPVFRKKVIEYNGCPPDDYLRKLHKPCVDISDQVAIIQSKVAHIYFGFPHHRFPFVVNSTELTKKQSAQLLESCQFHVSADKPMENVLNHRLRREGVQIAPYEFPFFLPACRFKIMDCPYANSNTPLIDCIRIKSDKTPVIKEMQSMKNHKELVNRCT